MKKYYPLNFLVVQSSCMCRAMLGFPAFSCCVVLNKKIASKMCGSCENARSDERCISLQCEQFYKRATEIVCIYNKWYAMHTEAMTFNRTPLFLNLKL